MLRKGFFEFLKSYSKKPFLFILFIFFSCTTTVYHNKEGITHQIEDIPFYAQEDYHCGPASLASVINYWGINIKPQDVAKEIFLKSVKGTLTIDMVLYAQKMGFETTQYEGDLEDLKTKIKNNLPLIVLVDTGYLFTHVYHFMVVTGFTDDGVIVNSGKFKGKIIKNEDFLNIWKKAGYWTLLIVRNNIDENK